MVGRVFFYEKLLNGSGDNKCFRYWRWRYIENIMHGHWKLQMEVFKTQMFGKYHQPCSKILKIFVSLQNGIFHAWVIQEHFDVGSNSLVCYANCESCCFNYFVFFSLVTLCINKNREVDQKNIEWNRIMQKFNYYTHIGEIWQPTF